MDIHKNTPVMFDYRDLNNCLKCGHRVDTDWEYSSDGGMEDYDYEYDLVSKSCDSYSYSESLSDCDNNTAYIEENKKYMFEFSNDNSDNNNDDDNNDDDNNNDDNNIMTIKPIKTYKMRYKKFYTRMRNGYLHRHKCEMCSSKYTACRCGYLTLYLGHNENNSGECNPYYDDSNECDDDSYDEHETFWKCTKCNLIYGSEEFGKPN